MGGGGGSLNPERGTGGSWYNSRWCSVEETLLFIPGHRFCLYQGVLNHTSDLAAPSALMACRLLPSRCDGVYVAGVWIGMAAASPFVQSLQYPGLWVAWTDDQGQQTRAARRHRSTTSYLGVWRGAAADTRSQASLHKLPQPLYRD